jgi:Methyltransferase domain
MGLKAFVRDLLPPIVLRALKPSRRPSSPNTIVAAQQAGLSVGDYVEQLWGTQGASAKVIQKLFDIGAISPATKTIVEIGPGTGRYLDHIFKRHQPERYQIYETAQDWAEWLASNYPIEACVADGQSLKQTDNASIDVVHAHGVFVYLPFLVSCSYFREIFRVTKREGFVAFDVISELCMTRDIVDKWLASVIRDPCILPKQYLTAMFKDAGFSLIETFTSPYGEGMSEYFVLQKLR